MRTSAKYVRVDPSAVPPGLRWDVPPINQGQIVEVAYACPGSRAAADEGDEWQRVTDRGAGTVKYYRRES